MASTTNFPSDTVPQAPEDPLFGLSRAFKADSSPDKVDLGIGAYRDDNAKPWVLPVVKKVQSSPHCTSLHVSLFWLCPSFSGGPPPA
jgi:aspartate/tyrosine/aromatic aminotransferase